MRKGGFCSRRLSGHRRYFAQFGAQVSPNKAGRICTCGLGRGGHIRPRMVDAEKEEPVMLPFADKEGTGWHVVVRYHEGHERRIDGFATEQEAVDWIMANSKEVEK